VNLFSSMVMKAQPLVSICGNCLFTDLIMIDYRKEIVGQNLVSSRNIIVLLPINRNICAAAVLLPRGYCLNSYKHGVRLNSVSIYVGVAMWKVHRTDRTKDVCELIR
jgi:hypothetical protein